MVLIQGGNALLTQCKNTLWMILEAEENASKSSSPGPEQGSGDRESSHERSSSPDSLDSSILDGINELEFVKFSVGNDVESEKKGLFYSVEREGPKFDNVDLLQGAAGSPPLIPPPLTIMGCTAKGIDCTDCKCKVVFKKSKGEYILVFLICNRMSNAGIA